MGTMQNHAHAERKDSFIPVSHWMLQRGVMVDTHSLFIGFQKRAVQLGDLLHGTATAAAQACQPRALLRGRSSRLGWEALTGVSDVVFTQCDWWRHQGNWCFAGMKAVGLTHSRLGWNYSCMIVCCDPENGAKNLSWPARAHWEDFNK